MYASHCNVDQSSARSSQPFMLYFFYGTLCDPDIQTLVLGYRPRPGQLQPACLSGFRRKQAEGRSYPVLIRSPGGQVDGLLFRPARPADAARLAAYEGPEYVSRRLPVQTGNGGGHDGGRRALVFLPAGSARGSALPPAKTDWALADWQRRHKPAFLRTLLDQGPMPCASR